MLSARIIVGLFQQKNHICNVKNETKVFKYDEVRSFSQYAAVL
jgi:hypothetical protein